MLSVVLVIQVIVTLFLITVIMIQKSEGGGLGIGGSGGGMGDFLGAKGTANLLTKVTSVLAATFMILSIVLAILSSRVNKDVSIVDTIVEQEQQIAPVEQVVDEAIVEEPVEEESELTPEMQKIKDSVEKSIADGQTATPEAE
jgi:preprotein translocase subunit SecG